MASGADQVDTTGTAGRGQASWLKEPAPVPIGSGRSIGVSSMHALSHIEGVHAVSSDPALPRPFVGIVGALHGNEPCGLAVLEALQDPEHPIRQGLRFGTLVLIHGNPDATRAGQRHTTGGVDLNRVFDFSFVHTVPRHAWAVEHHRALALRPVVESLDAVLDLHSATLPTDPFAIARAPFVPLARQLGCRHVTYGWERPEILSTHMLCSVVSARNRPAIAVECGQHDDPGSVARAFDVTARFLAALGLLPPMESRPGEPAQVVEVVHRVAKPGADFRFVRVFRGFDRVSRGETIGRGGGVDLVASDDFVVMLPNDTVAVGQDVLYLGRERPADRGAVSPPWKDLDSEREVA